MNISCAPQRERRNNPRPEELPEDGRRPVLTPHQYANVAIRNDSVKNSPLPSAAHLNLLLHLSPVNLGAWDAPRAMPFPGDEVHEDCHE